jgi:iron-sulfur cluster assembly protein
VLLDREEESKAGLRVAVIGGGCSGLQYKLGWDDPSERDEVHKYENGLLVIIDEKSAEFLKETTLEFHDSIERQGFEVKNPGASSCCGCGNSFSCG